MNLKRYILMDLLFFGILLVISEFLSVYLKISMNSKIFFSFGFLLQGVLIIRWKHIGLLVNVLMYILIAVLLALFVKYNFINTVITNILATSFAGASLLLVNYVEKKERKFSKITKLLFFIVLFTLFNVGESIGRAIMENKNIIINFSEFIYIQSLSFFLTFISVILLGNHNDLMSDQYKEIKEYRRKENVKS